MSDWDKFIDVYNKSSEPLKRFIDSDAIPKLSREFVESKKVGIDFNDTVVAISDYVLGITDAETLKGILKVSDTAVAYITKEIEDQKDECERKAANLPKANNDLKEKLELKPEATSISKGVAGAVAPKPQAEAKPPVATPDPKQPEQKPSEKVKDTSAPASGFSSQEPENKLGNTPTPVSTPKAETQPEQKKEAPKPPIAQTPKVQPPVTPQPAPKDTPKQPEPAKVVQTPVKKSAPESFFVKSEETADKSGDTQSTVKTVDASGVEIDVPKPKTEAPSSTEDLKKAFATAPTPGEIADEADDYADIDKKTDASARPLTREEVLKSLAPSRTMATDVAAAQQKQGGEQKPNT